MPKPSTIQPAPDGAAQFWRLPAVIAYTQRSRSSLYADKSFPRPVKLGPNTSAWLAAEVRAWADKQVAASRTGGDA